MEKEFVPHELAIKLKELGFDEPCFARFRKGQFQLNTLGKAIEHNSQQIVSGDVSAPLWQQAFDWFREKYKLEHWLSSSNDVTYYNIKEVGKVIYWDLELLSRKGYGTYEQSRHACLEKLIEIIQNKNDRSI